MTGRWQRLGLFGIGIPLLCLPGCGGGQDPVAGIAKSNRMVQVEVIPVEVTTIDSSIDVVGTLFPWKFATIASEVTGVIESIPDSEEQLSYELDGTTHTKVLPLDIGHTRIKDDVLLTISSTESEQELAVAKAKLRLAEKELANLNAWKRSEEVVQLRAQCEECDAIIVDAEADLERAKFLKAKRATSQKEVEDAERSVATANAAKKRADAALKLAEAGPTDQQIAVAMAQIDLAQADVAQKQNKCDKSVIKCPLDNATIVERYVGVGDHVTANPSTPLMRVVDSSILLAQVAVPERYQGLIKPRDPARMRAESGRVGVNEVDAMVVLVNGQIDPETRTFRVRVGMDNSSGVFTPGTFVKVTLPLKSKSDVVVVPAEAVAFAKGEPATFVYQDGRVERRPVVLGLSNRTHYQIVKGLDGGEQIVTGDLSLLANGLRVAPKDVSVTTTGSRG